MGKRSPVRCCCLLGPSIEGKHPENKNSLADSSSVLHRCRSVHILLGKIDVAELRLEQRMVPGQLLEVRQCPGELGQGSLDVHLGKYQPCRTILGLVQRNGG